MERESTQGIYMGFYITPVSYPLICTKLADLLSTGSEEREVLGVGSILVAILPSCQDMKSIAL